jgi:cysteinyl-tRNA synthetase
MVGDEVRICGTFYTIGSSEVWFNDVESEHSFRRFPAPDGPRDIVAIVPEGATAGPIRVKISTGAGIILGVVGTDHTFSEDFVVQGSPEDFRQHMRDFVQGISTYAKGIDSNFIIIPQNGHELLTENGLEDGPPAEEYLNAIDGVGREDLFYGYVNDNEATEEPESNYMMAFLDIAESKDIKVEVLVTDYCWTTSKVDDSYTKNAGKGYISFAADQRELDNIPSYPPDPFNKSSDNITSLAEAKNFLYLINPSEEYATKSEFLEAIANTNHDILIIDAFYGDNILTADDVATLKNKAMGGNRLVIAYMSIGEAEDYRYYWQTEWEKCPPSWLAEENLPDWPGNYKVRYWDKDWQDMIYGNDESYLKKILGAGFDGVYLDLIDAYEYFESP